MNKNILLVEDESIIALSEKHLLEQAGYNVKVVSNGLDAINSAPGFDLILMDIDLKDSMTGIEAAQTILNNIEIPVIFLSSHTEKDIVDKVKSVTNYGYVTKNSGMPVLLESMEMAFNLFEAKKNQYEGFKSLFKNSSSVMLIINPNGGRIIDANKAACSFYGYTYDELINLNVNDINILSKEEVEQEMALAYSEKRNYFNFIHRLKSGEKRNVEVYSNPITIGNETHLYSIIHDATEKILTLMKYENLVSLMEEGVAVYKPINDGEDFIFLDMNEAGLKSGNLKKEEIVGKSVGEVFPSVDKEDFDLISTFREVYRTGEMKTHPVSAYKDDRVSLWVENKVYKLDNGEIVAIYEDITERKRIEDELRKSEENVKITLDSIGDGVVSVDLNKVITRVNPTAEKIIGCAEKDCVGKNIDEVFKIISAITGERASTPIDEVLETGEVRYLENHVKLISFDGKEYHIADSAAPIKNSNDDILGVVFVFRDISEQYEKSERIKLNEKNLFLFRERLEAIMRAGDIAWWELDLNTGLVSFNEQKAIMLGRKHEEFHHYMDFVNLVHPEDQDRIMNEMKDLIEGRSALYDTEYRTKHRDGHYVWFHDIGKIVDWEGSKPIKVTGVVLNISEAKEREERLQSLVEEKQELVKEMNHRIKNNLAIVKSFISLKSFESPEDFSDILSQIESIITLHEKLYEADFFHTLNLKDYIESLLQNIFSLLTKESVKIDVDISEDVEFNSKKTVNVGLIVNELATNAIKHGFKDCTNTCHFHVELEKNNEVYKLVVSNTGEKFPENFNLEGSNSLGLKIIKTLVDQMNGDIHIEREPITKFIITFEEDAE